MPQAAAILMRQRPAAIFTTGGYVAIPVLLAAAPLGIPVVLWDGNVIPGRAVRATARLARVLAVSFEATCRALGSSAGSARPCYVTGTPIRDVRDVDREAARRRLEIAPSERVLLVFGGSQTVRRFNAAVSAALPKLVERVTVIHVAGEDGYAAALAAREALPEASRHRYRPYPFLRDDMLTALAAADLVVGRAGLVDARRGDRARPADGRRAVSARRRPPAGQCREPGRSRRRAAGRRRGVRRGGPARRGRAARRSGGARRDVGGGARPRPARCDGGGRRAGAWPARHAPAAAGAARRSSDSPRGGRGDDRRLRRDRDRRPRSSGGSGSRPRATSRSPASRRCASAARPTCSRRRTTPSSCAALVRFARSRGPAAPRPRPRQRPGHRRRRRARPGHPGPRRGLADRGRPVHGRGRASRWPAPRPRRRAPG